METLPTYAKVSEYQLGILSPDDAPRNVMNLKLQAASKSRELWAGQVAFATMAVDDLKKLLAWLAQMDGRYSSWLLPMPAGLQTIAGSHTGTLAAAVASGASSLSLTVSPVSGTIKAGTLLTLGTNTADAYQVIEVLADVVVSGNPVTVQVSPRMRWAFSSGATVTFGETSLRVRLMTDDAPSNHDFSITHGVLTLDLIESIYA